MRRELRKRFLNWRERLRPRPKLLGVNPTTHVLLLDVDGVLVNAPDWFNSQFLKTHPDAVRDFFRSGAFDRASTGKSDLLDELPSYLEALGQSVSPAEFVQQWCEYENHPVKAMLDAAQQLKAAGWRIYLATNQEAHRTRHLLEESGLDAVTDGHFASYAVGHRKPSAEYYAEVTRRLGLAPQQLIFWDDVAENVTAAREAGWTAYLFTDAADFVRVMGR